MSVCLSGRVTKTTIAPIDLIFFQISIMLVARSSTKMNQIGTRIWPKNLFKDPSPLGCMKNMPSIYSTTSNVHYCENMRYDVTCAS